MSGPASLVPAAGLAITALFTLPLGEHPFVVALALAMAGAAALGAQRPAVWALGGVSAGLALFVNPLGFLCVAVFLAADLLGRPELRRRHAIFAAGLAPLFLVRAVMLVAFAQPSIEIDLSASQARYVAIGVTAALLVRLSRDPDRRAKSLVFAVAAVACALAWAMPRNPVGDDMGRFYLVFAVPVLLGVRRLFVPLRAVAVVTLAALVLPLSLGSATATRPVPSYAQWQAFFAPGLRLADRFHDADYRFEVVPLARHWEAYFFPLAGYPLAQGWYRQSDALHDLVLREGVHLTAVRYATWLRSVGVKYVFVGDAALESDAAGIPTLLAGSSQFTRVASAGRWTVYRVSHPRPLVTRGAWRISCPATVTDYERTRITLVVRRRGDYVVKATWSPYWTLDLGRGSLSQAQGDWIDLQAARPGVYDLTFSVTPGRLLAQLLRLVAGAGPAGATDLSPAARAWLRRHREAPATVAGDRGPRSAHRRTGGRLGAAALR